MTVLDFALVAHRVGTRLRLRVPGRRGDAEFFDRLGRALSQCDDVLSVQSNPLTGSLVIRHTASFDLSPSGLARFGIACTVPALISRVEEPRLDVGHVKLIGFALQIILAAVARQPIQLAHIIAELCLETVVRQLTRPQVTPAASSSS
jgi:hypothetical protein